MKDGTANNSTASISQARKAVEQLKMEACMDRIKVHNMPFAFGCEQMCASLFISKCGSDVYSNATATVA